MQNLLLTNHSNFGLLDEDIFDQVSKLDTTWRVLFSKYGEPSAIVSAKAYYRDWFSGSVRYGAKQIYLHRFVMNVVWKDRRIFVDHIDHNIFNNQRNNLRLCSKVQNDRNSVKCRNGSKSKTSSKYKGVCFTPNDCKERPWLSYIPWFNKNIFIGYFGSENDAALAYNCKAKELYKEFANPNIIS